MITEQQRKDRQLGIGGSDMPIILGLSSYKTRYQLYLEKTGDIVDDQNISEQAYWGSTLEPIIRNEFIKRNNVHIELPDTIIHPEYNFLRANLDGFIPEQNSILEIKCTSSFKAHEWGEKGSDIIPYPYLVQVAYYCMVKNADSAYIAVLIGGNEYREFRYSRDLELEDYLMDAAKEFWNCVQTRNPPPAVNQLDLRLMYPTHNPEKIKRVDDKISNHLKNLNKARFSIKSLNELEENHKFNIMQYMGDAECLVNEEGNPIVSWKANKKGSRVFLMKGV